MWDRGGPTGGRKGKSGFKLNLMRNEKQEIARKARASVECEGCCGWRPQFLFRVEEVGSDSSRNELTFGTISNLMLTLQVLVFCLLFTAFLKFFQRVALIFRGSEFWRNKAHRGLLKDLNHSQNRTKKTNQNTTGRSSPTPWNFTF